MKILFLGLVLVIQGQVHASIYKLRNEKDFNPSDRSKIDLIFAEAEKILPDTLKSKITEVSVQFSGDDEKITITCSGDKGQATKFLGMTTNILGKKQISLNKAFLKHFSTELSDGIEYPCKHKNYFKEVVATLIHETVHVYENVQGNRPSKERVFRNNVFFMKNILSERSPDAYEFSNYQESYAVNFEYFLMDPEFKCRKPSLYSLYSKEFKVTPHDETQCLSTTKGKISGRSDFTEFNEKRLYQIDYLMAGPGKAMMSRFGHSMLRLVMCAPKREVGPDCLKDVSYHIILSFRANMGSSSSAAYMYGLVGKFPSQLFIASFSKVVDEYNRDEFRSLSAFPLKLTKTQKKKFLDHALETHWTYSGKYYFTHNNCAVETKQLISSVLEEDHPFRKTKSPTPADLRNDLFDHGLIENPEFIKEQVSTLYFPSKYKEELNLALERVAPFTERSFSKLEEYLEDTTALEREEWFKKVKKDKKVQMSFFMLEQNISKAINKKIGSGINKLYKRKDLASDDRKLIDHYLKLQSELSPWYSLKKSPYGIPSEKEIDQQAAIEAHANFVAGNNILVDILKKYDQDLVSDFQKNQENIKNFFWLK